ncbi:hypothetical protein K474DRAFT_1726847 [Panus rudis PR-1116 ss-1]|nr:hypothetical protein K474DRAFT_1726847 [Panus rudis PR-1116 ss-1]
MGASWQRIWDGDGRSGWHCLSRRSACEPQSRACERSAGVCTHEISGVGIALLAWAPPGPLPGCIIDKLSAWLHSQGSTSPLLPDIPSELKHGTKEDKSSSESQAPVQSTETASGTATQSSERHKPATLQTSNLSVTDSGPSTPRSPSGRSKRKFKYYHADASYNIRTGRTSVRELYPGCSVVGWIGMDTSTLTFTHIDGGSGGEKLVEIHYICGDDSRDLYLSVNGTEPQKVTLPKSGKRWEDIRFDFRVPLKGFEPGRKNTITLSNPSGWGPDIFRVGVEQG